MSEPDPIASDPDYWDVVGKFAKEIRWRRDPDGWWTYVPPLRAEDEEVSDESR